MRVEERTCRLCGGRLSTVLDLGMLAISDFPDPQRPSERREAPLDLCQCLACKTVQLRHTVEPDALFRHYWYRSGVNETMRAELQDLVKVAVQIVAVGGGDVVVDVGANDGTLLSTYSLIGRSPYRVAVEPAENLIAGLHQHADLVVPHYFPHPSLDPFIRRVSHVFSIACFYDLDDPGAFVSGVASLLAEDGVWIVQFQDLHQMLQARAFDNICHEHLVYYSLRAVEALIAPYGLRVVHAERRAINGGSYRLIIRRKPYEPDETVAAIREQELGCEHAETLEQFARQVGEMQLQLRAFLSHFDGQPVDLYGASTKGNTLLQIVGLGPNRIRQAWERSPEKWGHQTITGIPIVSEQAGREDPPALLLVGIWQFRDAILQREAVYLDQGGDILFPLPVIDLVQASRRD